MKITLSPIKDQEGESVKFYTITVESSADSITITEAVDMFFQAMIGWGYSPDEVHKQLNEFTR